MEQIIRTHIKVIGLTCSLFFLLLAIGCSDFSNPVASATDNASLRETPFGKYESLEGLYDNPYPEITAEMLAAGPAPGYQYVQWRRASALDNELECDSMSARVQARPNNERDCDLVGEIELTIPRYRVSENVWVSMVSPLACMGILDFYPHPYQFNDYVEVFIKLSELDIDEDDWGDLVPLYVNDDGSVTEMWHHFPNSNELIFRTDHFSRYILAQRVGG